MNPKSQEKPHNLHIFNRKGDEYEHVKHVDDWLDYYHTPNEDVKCKLFALILTKFIQA